MANLIPLEEAARMLGIPTDALTELISQGEIRGFKSGSTWKFKPEELQRVAEEKGYSFDGGQEDLSEELSLDDSFSLDDDELSLEEVGSDVLSEAEAKSEDSPSDTGKLGDDGDDLLLAEDDLFDDSELSLAGGSDIVDSDSDLEDSDLVLDESSSSEIGLSSDDSGISLGPSDSGLSLDEEPAELSGSDLDSLALPEDDSLVAVDDLGSDVQADDDFMLSPIEEAAEDETSGSQVIALDDSEIYPDDSASGLLSDSAADEAGEDAPVLVADEGDVFGEAIVTEDEQGQPVTRAVAAEPPEKPYTVPQVLALASIFLLLALSMMLVLDNARNMWNGRETSKISAPVADMLINMVGLESK